MRFNRRTGTILSVKKYLAVVFLLILVPLQSCYPQAEELTHHIPLLPNDAIDRRFTAEAHEGHALLVGAIYQGDYGTHYVDLWCGTPPQRQTLIINTGAPGTAFPCSSTCGEDCGLIPNKDQPFVDPDSSTYHKLTCNECSTGRCPDDESTKTCEFGVRYSEGSGWLADEVLDHCYIGGLHDTPETFGDGGKDDADPRHAADFGFSLRFGCQTLRTGVFRALNEDGVLSMDNSPNSFWRQMLKANKIDDEMFSLCFSKQSHKSTSSEEDASQLQTGALTLGGSDPRLHSSRMLFTKHEQTWSSSFGVLVRKIYLREGGGGDSAKSTKPNLKIIPVGLNEADLNKGPILLESGLSDTFFTRDLFPPFQKAWRELMGVDFAHHPLYISYEMLQLLPTILIQMEGSEDLNKEVFGIDNKVVGLAGELDSEYPFDVILAVPPNHYMAYSPSKDAYMARFFMVDPPSGGSFLGANALMGHDVLFDATNNRIGWAESGCDYAHLLEDAGFGSQAKRPAHPQEGDEETVTEPSKGALGSFVMLAGIVITFMYVRQDQISETTGRLRRYAGTSDYQPVLSADYPITRNVELGRVHAPYHDSLH